MHTSARQEKIIQRLIEDEMRESFIDYSMSVIVQRALPDARDGLKPVHRRILYAMYQLGLLPERAHKKAATVVGDVLGKYHPHGDTAVYDSLVRMVQEFSLRYPLIDGQGNFGSIDGDSPAAYRYTEAKLAPIALELLADIERDTVDFVPNFDGRLEEPEILPARLPHLLLNGADGIAVGMATRIPPHNLRELLHATDHLVRHPDCDIDDLMKLVRGPDFPTAGYIWGRDGIEDAYRTGRGLVEMRARMHLEEGNYGKSHLVVTELPYQVNKTRVIEQITKVVRAGRIENITDLRDESDRDGIRLVIELKRDTDVRKLVRTLFRKTQLRNTFGIIMLALVDGRPVELNLKQAIESFVEHRLEVIGRRAAHELAQSEERAHVVEGLLTALDDIDRVIELIRGSRTPKSAHSKLRKELKLSDRQADAILAMRLARLTGLERRKLERELEALRARIAELRQLVAEDAHRRKLMRKEIQELIARFGDERRTTILDAEGTFPLPTGGSAGAALVLLSRLGYIKAQPVRTGSGMAGAEALESRRGDFVRQAFVCRGTDPILLVTARGDMHRLTANDLPRGTRTSRGNPVSEFLELGRGDRIVAAIPTDGFPDERFLLTVTRRGQVKRTPLPDYANVRAGGIAACGLSKGDEVLAAAITGGGSELVLATRAAQAIRFAEDEVRPMGRTARGVRGIELEKDDEVVAALTPRHDADLIAGTAGGYGKRLPLTEFRQQGRAGKGTGILPERATAGDLVGLVEVHAGDRIMWELASGDMVASASGALGERGRRDASVRIPEVAETGERVIGVYTVRASPESAGAPAPDAADAAEEEESAAGDEGAAGNAGNAGEGQQELELTG